MAEPSQTKHCTKVPLHTLLYYLYLGGHLIRFLISALILNLYPLQVDYFRYDLLFGLFVQLNFLDGKLAIALWPAVLLLIYLDYTVHFRRGLYCVHLVHDLMIVNRLVGFFVCFCHLICKCQKLPLFLKSTAVMINCYYFN